MFSWNVSIIWIWCAKKRMNALHKDTECLGKEWERTSEFVVICLMRSLRPFCTVIVETGHWENRKTNMGISFPSLFGLCLFFFTLCMSFKNTKFEETKRKRPFHTKTYTNAYHSNNKSHFTFKDTFDFKIILRHKKNVFSFHSFFSFDGFLNEQSWLNVSAAA